MRQVLIHIPLNADWRLLLAIGGTLGLLVWLLSLRTQRPALREVLRTVAAWLAGVGVLAALVVRFAAPHLPDGLPIYGFGMMLFLAFLLCTWIAGRRAESEGVAKEHIQDLAIWVFIGGLLGARIAHLTMEQPHRLSPKEILEQIYRIWDGGIVLYGSVIGGLIGYAGAYLFIFRRYHLSTLKLADIVAPSIAVGLCLGRLGCFLNGCCYGQIACPTCPVYAVHFPLSAPAREGLVAQGYQSAAGFLPAREEEQPANGVRVGVVDPDSAAFAHGLRKGDVIVALNGHPIANPDDLYDELVRNWPRGESELTLTIQPQGAGEKHSLTCTPRTLGLHPTQLYEVVSMTLMLLLLTAYYPFRRREGQVMAVLMVGYGVHRWLNEMLRDDPRPKGFESYTSLVLLACGVALWLWLQTRPQKQLEDASAKHP